MSQDAAIPICNEPWLGEADVWLLKEGRHLRPWEKLGAHPCTLGGRAGTAFAVWAPNARQVSVVGDFNRWDARQHVMQHRVECGAWEVFVPGVREGSLYKFSVQELDGQHVLKTDPYALHSERGAGRAGIVMNLPEPVPRPTGQRATANALTAPMAIYEVHVGSWRRPNGAPPDWDELARTLVPYVAALGFTHIELMPVSEPAFQGPWGDQSTGLYAPMARYGTPDAFRGFVTAAHNAGLQVLLDWVPAPFPADAQALGHFESAMKLEALDPREACQGNWRALIDHCKRVEVRNFLVGSALFWVECYGVDGLRLDAVTSMLYRDHSCSESEWIAHHEGVRENHEAIDFLRELNRMLRQEAPGAITVAEESTAYPGVTAPPGAGGLGFHHKWNLGWMHDTLTYFSMDPVHRSQQHDRITFALMYAYSERFVLALSHDEVVQGKGSLYSKMWGAPWQKRANLRALYALMYAHPGRKLLFMGSELAQVREWNHDGELDWQ
ncbi:MAG: 1,4-alpha-glucan branching enzyme, partial [Rhodoferax sp.]